jgi:hypothetical protein
MDEEAESTERESPPKMSMIPSWVMLGFVLGALFVGTLPPLKKQQPAPPVAPPAFKNTPAAAPPALPQLSTIEAVFSVWGENAVWDHDTTEVALWNTDLNRFADFYEVRRVGDLYYFRTIPKLTRRIINHGKQLPVNCPLQFTETEAQYLEWREHGRSERRPDPATQSEAR